MDTYPSDTEKEPDPNYQVIDKKINISSDAGYAIPHKIKQVSTGVSASASFLNTVVKIINSFNHICKCYVVISSFIVICIIDRDAIFLCTICVS